MRWMKHLYIGDLADRREKEILRRIRRRRPVIGAWVLMPASNPQNQIDILQANVLLQGMERERDRVIVGLAGSRSDAVQLVLRITDECYRLTKTADLRGFLERRIREEGTEEIL